MRLYSGTTKSLIEDSTYNRIATKLKDAFFLEFRYQPAVAEVNSWNNSLRAVSQVFKQQACSIMAFCWNFNSHSPPSGLTAL